MASIDGGELAVAVERLRREERPAPELWLAQALAKGDRDELAIQAATELGVSGVIPWQAERSVSRWEGAKAAKGRERWRSIVREASKQSIRAWVPEVAEPATTKALAAAAGLRAGARAHGIHSPDRHAARRARAHHPGRRARRAASRRTSSRSSSDHVRLGPEVLRTSTAGPAALAVLNARLGRW